jgi:hypothetical protein
MTTWQKNAFVAVVSALFIALVLVFVKGVSVLTHLSVYQVGFWIWIIYVGDRLYKAVGSVVDESLNE